MASSQRSVHCAVLVCLLFAPIGTTACGGLPHEGEASDARATRGADNRSAQRNPLEAPAKAWSISLDGLGTFSSPRVADLNGDGIRDVILGTGRLEFEPSDTAAVALDGRTGRILWHVGARDQMFGSAAMAEIDGDGILDVVIGGRSAELKAVDGARGRILWEFFPDADSAEIREAELFNFYNPQFVDDLDGDGVDDLVVSNGGDVLALPEDGHRPAGRLFVISGASGRPIAAARVPDGRETYMSPVVADLEGDGALDVIFGTGGETIGGRLYRAPLDDLVAGDLSNAAELASGGDRGFIGPPVLVDLTCDGILDVVANAVEGRMVAIDGSSNLKLWSVRLTGTESYTSPAVGFFTDDDVPDLFGVFAMGTWPDLGWSRQVMVDGRTGEIAFADSLGLYLTSSPVAVDLNGDGRDEVILSVNIQTLTPLMQTRFYTMLVAIDFATDEIVQLGDPLAGSNLASTPWVGDLDDDGLLDVVTVNTPDSLHTYVFNGLQVNRITTNIPLRSEPAWGAYMGNLYDGIFRTPSRRQQHSFP